MSTLISKQESDNLSNNHEYLYGYVFWYNPYEKMWYAINRETQIIFFGGDREKSKFFKAKEANLLIDFLEREYIKNVTK